MQVYARMSQCAALFGKIIFVIHYLVFVVRFHTMPVSFTNVEYADMILVYGYTNQNAREAVREYQRRFPHRRVPNKSVFPQLYRRASETGSLGIRQRAELRQTGDPNNEQNVLAAVAADPTTSTRRIGLALQIPHVRVHRVLRGHGFHPFHLTPVQNLLPTDGDRRVEFCQWYLDHFPYRGDRILWTDEATFTRRGIFNMRNSHVYAHENPDATITSHYQHEFRVNIWMGMMRGQLIGPLEIPPRLNAAGFVELLDNQVYDILEDMPLLERRALWWQMDGCPAHNARIVSEWLNNHFQDRMEEDYLTVNGIANRQMLDVSSLQNRLHTVQSEQLTPANPSEPKAILPTYEEAITSPGHIILQESHISTVYSPHFGFGPPVFPCEHEPHRECSFCSRTSFRRCSLRSTPEYPTRMLGRCERGVMDFHRRRVFWMKIMFFLFVLSFFLVMSSILYDVILAEPVIYPNPNKPPVPPYNPTNT